MKHLLHTFLVLALCASAHAQTAVVPSVNSPLTGPGAGNTPATIWTPTASQAVSTTSDVSFFSSTGVGVGQTIAANAAVVGNRYRLHVGGYYIVPTSNTDVLTIKIKWGTTTITSNTITPAPASSINFTLAIDVTCTVTAIGNISVGKMNCSGMITYLVNSGGAGAPSVAGLFTSTAQAIDTTASSKIDLTGAWSAITGSPSAVGVDGAVEIVN